MIKKGDTLIEVTLAVGIFSMIAIAIVAVMSSGTSSAQTALETTLARNEIDAQAESLRFIHTSYIATKSSANKTYQDLWDKITKAAVTGSSVNNDLLQYAPTNCADLYATDAEVKKYAFIIDYRNLGVPSKVKDSFVVAKTTDKFRPASTYPRLVYQNESTSELSADPASFSTLLNAEGIYVIAVKDQGTTATSKGKTSAFYDFYIRTCWYGSNADEPSTISTIIRLYDPKAVE